MLQKRVRIGLGLQQGKEAIKPRNKSSRPNPPPAQRRIAASSRSPTESADLAVVLLGPQSGPAASSQPIGGGPAPCSQSATALPPLSQSAAALRPLSQSAAALFLSANLALRAGLSWLVRRERPSVVHCL